MRLSPSTLSDFVKCPRCWVLDRKHKVAWPRGVFPSLPGGMDRRLKVWADAHRTAGKLPPELVGRVPGGLFNDQETLDRWRNWRSGPTAVLEDGTELGGALDDLLFDPATGLYSVIDFKTRGAPPKKGDSEKYYGLQMSSYRAILERMGRKTTEKAYLIYYWPKDAKGGEPGGPFSFDFCTEVVEIMTDADGAVKTALAAARAMDGPLPEPGIECERCQYVGERRERILEIQRAKAEAEKPKEGLVAWTPEIDCCHRNSPGENHAPGCPASGIQTPTPQAAS